jgi:uncharacterized repeat protein (TIGR02543 family)
MRAELSEALEDCLSQIRRGVAIEACVARYPDLREELRPLLLVARSISTVPKVSPSSEFRTASRERLVKRISEPHARAENRALKPEPISPGLPGKIWRELMNTLRGPRLLYAPVALAFVFIMAIAIAIPVSQMASAPAALASQCTISVLGGSAEVQSPGSDSWQPATDGAVLEAGGRVKTGPDSSALLTFFEGSTIKLEPGADVQIQTIQTADGGGGEIVLKQWIGRTWSRVVQRLDPGSHYEIQTPTAVAVVRGTLFETEVAVDGSTVVRTVEGLVSVISQETEVLLAPSQQSTVRAGIPPSLAQIIAAPDNDLIIGVGMPAVASVCDPTGASVGFLPTGLSFNQITGAQSTSPAEGTQIITIPEPLSGEYLVVLRGIADGTSQLVVEGMSMQQTVVRRAATCALTDGSEWVLPINVEIENGLLIDIVLGDIEPLQGAPPEKLVESESAAASLVPIEPPDASAAQAYTLSVASAEGGSVIEPGEGTFVCAQGEIVNLTAVPDCGYGFAGWGGDIADTLATTSITVDKDTTVVAKFVRSYMLVVVATGGGSVTVPNQGILYFREGETVNLVATADTGYVFSGWTGNVADPSLPVTTITMKQDEVVTASFVGSQ